MNTDIKLMVQKRIIEDVIRNNKSVNWKVLILDKIGTRIISTCCKMHDIMKERVILVEDFDKRRQPLQDLDAIYLIQPSENAINKIIDDFKSENKYKAAHIFFLQACSDQLLTKLGKSTANRYIETCKEINISFLPCEKLVYSLDSKETFSIVYQTSTMTPEKMAHYEQIADQIATVCCTLGEYPKVRYRSAFPDNNELAKLVQRKLDMYKADDPNMNTEGEKARSQLLILDRAFDAVSPLLHELTYQAMVYDLVNIENDTYQYKGGMGNPVETVLDENDALWVQLRHKHIRDVYESVNRLFKEFMKAKNTQNTEKIKDLAQVMKKMPQYQKEVNSFALHISLAHDCDTAFKDRVNKLCEVEQNITHGTDGHGEKIKGLMQEISLQLIEPEIKIEDKLRLIILFLLLKNGISEENLMSLLDSGNIPDNYKQVLLNLEKLGLQVLLQSNRYKNIPENRKRRGEGLVLSRWTPFLKDLLENIIEEKLNDIDFPSVSSRTAGLRSVGISARSNWKRSTGNRSRIIVFVLGGVTYSEMRCAYEVTNENPSWEVVIGGDHVITPKQFLKDLELKKPT